jgi:hypothetical protein
MLQIQSGVEYPGDFFDTEYTRQERPSLRLRDTLLKPALL